MDPNPGAIGSCSVGFKLRVRDKELSSLGLQVILLGALSAVDARCNWGTFLLSNEDREAYAGKCFLFKISICVSVKLGAFCKPKSPRLTLAASGVGLGFPTASSSQPEIFPQLLGSNKFLEVVNPTNEQARLLGSKFQVDTGSDKISKVDMLGTTA